MSPVDAGCATPSAPQSPGPSDAELLAAVRGRAADAASATAFGVLYDRHQEAARALARQLARTPADAEDLVSAAFARLLEVLRAGGGPTEAFRAYLLTSVRHLAYDRSRAERRLDLTEDIGDVVGVDPERTVVPFADPAVAGLERSLAARAFATLPERWQAVLWHLEVEGDSPADVAPLFGLTPNAVSALGYRAREGLRQAYLQEHLAADASGSPLRDRRHRETGRRLGAYTRGGLSRRDATRVEAHLRECEECRALAEELREVNSGIVRAAVGPAVLGAALVGYLASRGAGGSGYLASAALPSTAELVVAGGGALGVVTGVGGALRPSVLRPAALGPDAAGPGRRQVVAAAVGLVGLGMAFGVAGPVGLGGPVATVEPVEPGATGEPGGTARLPPVPASPAGLGVPLAPVPVGTVPSSPTHASARGGDRAASTASGATAAGTTAPAATATGSRHRTRVVRGPVSRTGRRVVDPLGSASAGPGVPRDPVLDVDLGRSTGEQVWWWPTGSSVTSTGVSTCSCVPGRAPATRGLHP